VAVRPARRTKGGPARRKHDYVFVVTYGRSGSTLVQGMLNALPRTLVRGENGFYVEHLFQAARTAVEFRDQFQGNRARRVSSAFYGVNHLTRRRFARSANRLITGILLGSDDAAAYDRIGFKEVLWHRIAPDDTEPFFAWFDQVFPEAKYVLNTRETEQVVGSGFWQRKDADEAMAAIQRVIEIQDHLRATRPDRVHETRYEVITGEDRAASDAALRGLAEFVTGSCDDAVLEALRATLEVGHGPNPFGKSRRQKKDA
jgi:hypothetical protein